MNSLSSFRSVDYSCNETLGWLNQVLSHEGLRILRTFDLQAARDHLAGYACPHHGTQDCDCQMIVVLVYGQAVQPVTLVLHGNDGHTWLSMVNSPAQPLDPATQAAIENIINRSIPE